MYYIYEIYNDVTQRRYIGLTQYPNKRFQQHQILLHTKKHTAENIVADCIKYGEEHFSFRIIDTANSKSEGLMKENKHILMSKSYVPEFGYNGNDSRFRRPSKSVKCNDSELSRRIKKQGYYLRDVSWKLGLSYHIFIMKLNHPDLFTENELSNLNEYLKITKRERTLVSWNEYCRRMKIAGQQ